MATKRKTTKKAGSSGSKTSKVVGVAKSLIGKATTTTKGYRKSKKRGALWYAKEIQRLKLKKRYEKIKYRV